MTNFWSVLISRGCPTRGVREELNEQGRSGSGNDYMNQVQNKEQYQFDLNKFSHGEDN
jgi:hypothetical protein